ncbi:MAG: alpha/beta family hydrolase, partial [Candidatus Hydrogenedentales bacterium]
MRRSIKRNETGAAEYEVTLNLPDVTLTGDLNVPEEPAGIVIFAHGSGSGRFSTRNQFVADQLQEAGMATLLFDLLTQEEDQRPGKVPQRFNIPLLGTRMCYVVDWCEKEHLISDLPIGLFGASTGAAAALIAAAERARVVRAVVSRGGRPDLAGDALPRVRAPALFIVGGADVPVIGLNESAAAQMTPRPQIEIVPGATHLFEEPGTLAKVAQLAAGFFA